MTSYELLSAGPKSGLSNKLATDALAETLLPVQLTPEQETSLFGAFYPRRQVQKTNPTMIKHYAMLVHELAQVSYDMNCVLSLLRFALNDSVQKESLDKDELLQRVRDMARSMKSSNVVKTSDLKARAFLENTATSPSFVIKPSQRFHNGQDLVYSGIPRTDHMDPGSGLRVIPLVNNHLQDYNPNSPTYQLLAGSDYATGLAKRAKQAGIQLHKELFPDSGAEVHANANKRYLSYKHLKYEFSRFNGMLDEVYGGRIGANFFEDLISPDLIRALDKYVSILAIKDAHPSVVQHVKRHFNASVGDPLPIDVTKAITEEHNLLSPIITFSLVIHLPEEFVSFITQTPSDQPLALTHLNTWANVWTSAMLRPMGRSAAARVKMRDIPKYIVPPSRTKQIVEKRKELGYYAEEGRNNEDGLMVSSTGTLQYCPKTSEQDMTTALAYEKDMNEMLSLAFDFGLPSVVNKGTPIDGIIASVGPSALDISNKVFKKQEQINKYAGALISYTWDYNNAQYVSSTDPSRTVSRGLAGSTVPSNLAIADYLGIDFAKDGEPRQAKSFKEAMLLMTVPGGLLNDSPETYSTPSKLVECKQFQDVFAMYKDLSIRGHVPRLQELITKARLELVLPENLNQTTYEKTSYFEVLNDDMTLRNQYTTEYDVLAPEVLSKLLSGALFEAIGERTSSLRKSLLEENNYNQDVVDQELEDHPYHFNFSMPMAKFGNVYNYLGGKVFQLVCRSIMDIDRKLMIDVNVEEREKFPPSILGKPLPFVNISTNVIPVCAMFARYVPQATEIMAQAMKEIEANRPNDSLTVDDIVLPGSKPGFEIFPHQLKMHKSLRNRPKFAILDVSPGGGKTAGILTDVVACSKETGDIKPLLLAPDNLVKNWCEDLVKVEGGNWNVIPLTTLTFSRWGEEKLRKLLESTPPNTIVVAGLNFLKSKTYPVVIGTHINMVSGAMEFVKRFNFNYIALDESHKAKKFTSLVHSTVKQLTTSSNVKFVRLATGTLISNKLTDIVGQAALLSAHMFRTPEEYEAENALELKGSQVVRWNPDTPQKARQKLARHSAVITLKKKEWAFMLPSPIETMHAVALEAEGEGFSEVHQQVYNTVLEQSIELLSKLTKKTKEVMEDDDEPDNNEEDLDNEDDRDFDAAYDMDSEAGDQFEGLEGLLDAHIARLEMLLTDPLGDPLGKEIFERAGASNFVSRKVRKIIERIDTHFNIQPWQKGKAYLEYSLVTHKGKTWLARKKDTTTFNRKELAASIIEPELDQDYWREEDPGKVLVFCRYTRSVEAIYEALPEKYKKVARKYTSKEKDRAGNMEAFKKSKDVQILIVNEQSVAEGHNLQMGGRIIRSESPWAPGDLDQSSSRIFRPDPAGAKAGKLRREVIFLDWVICNNTLEVPKMGRLIHKIVNKLKFDELGNSLYDPIMDIDLPSIPMTLEMISSTPNFSEISEYTATYSALSHIQSEEFSKMRQTQEARMLPIEPSPVGKDYKRIEHVPYLHDQAVADMNGYGLQTGREFFEDETNKAMINDQQLAVGLPVHTEFGNGQIVSISTKQKTDKNGDPIFTPLGQKMSVPGPAGIRNVTIRLKSGEVIKEQLSSIYIATTVTDATIKTHFLAKGAKAYKPEVEEETPKEKKARETAEARSKKELEKAAVQKVKQDLVNTRKANRLRGRPEDEGTEEIEKSYKLSRSKKDQTHAMDKKPVSRLKARPEPEEEEDRAINLFPVIYNGFLALEAESDDPDSKLLKNYGFVHFGNYAYVKVKNMLQYHKVLDFLEANYTMSTATERRLEAIQEAFEEAKTYSQSKFKSEIYDVSSLPNFFRTKHRMVANRKEVKVYPVAMPETLVLAVDMQTNPGFKKSLGKSIGPGLKWQEADGLEIYFARSKQEVADTVKAIMADGITVTNKKELLADLRAMKFTRITGK